MQRKSMSSVIKALTVIALPMVASFSTAGYAMHPHGSQPSAASGAGANPLIEEMIVLDNAFREVVSAVAMGDGERVYEALHAMHGTMEKTHKGIHEGEVKIPKNADRETEFMQMDIAFHEDIEGLAEAGKKKDQQKMLALTKKLLDGCVDCHRDFRK
jgi:cytochrome c556